MNGVVSFSRLLRPDTKSGPSWKERTPKDERKKGTVRQGPEGVRNCEISIKFASKTRNVREANLQGGRDDSKVAAVGGQGEG